jgi:hypothetical protein
VEAGSVRVWRRVQIHSDVQQEQPPEHAQTREGEGVWCGLVVGGGAGRHPLLLRLLQAEQLLVQCNLLRSRAAQGWAGGNTAALRRGGASRGHGRPRRHVLGSARAELCTGWALCLACPWMARASGGGGWGTFHSASIGNSSPRLIEPSPSVSQCESTNSTSAANVSGGRRHAGRSSWR